MTSEIEREAEALCVRLLQATGILMQFPSEPRRPTAMANELRSALLDFARAIVAEVKAPQTPAAEPAIGGNVTCTDADLALAVMTATGLASASPTSERTILARALLRLRGERDAYRALLAADYALKRAFYHAPESRQDALLDERSRARQAALDEVMRVDGEFAREAMREPERDEGLTLPTLAPDALPTVPGMADADARLRAEMVERGKTAG